MSTVTETLVPLEVPGRRVSLGEGAAAVVALLWLGIVIVWTARFWLMLRDAAPVLAMFEAEAGRPLSGDEWLVHEEARAIFCAHPDDDPAENRIGRHINADWAYTPLLFFGSLFTYASGGVAGLATQVASRRWIRRLPLLMAIAGAVPVLVILTNVSVIEALTNITE